MNAKQARNEFEKKSGVRPVGRGYMTSEVVQAENDALKQYGEALQAAGPANCAANAQKVRQAYVSYCDALDKLDKGGRGKQARKTFQELNLDC